jgi:ankyrin repeat protein
MGCSESVIMKSHNINSLASKKIESKIPNLPNVIAQRLDSTCQHLYFDKLEGKYICMDCGYVLQEPICLCFNRYDADIDRIESEQEIETHVLHDSLPLLVRYPIDSTPEISVNEMSHIRGVSIAFLLAFTQKFDCWDKSSWWIIRNIIKPMTQSSRCRFVELDWMAEHVGPAKTYISYAHRGTWGDLVAAILDGGADLNRKVWLDIFAVHQWPSDIPDLDFVSTIQQCESFLCVCSYVESADEMEVFNAAAAGSRSRNDANAYATDKDGFTAPTCVCQKGNMGCIDMLLSKGIEIESKKELIPAADREKIALFRAWCLVEMVAAAMKADMPRIIKCGRHKINSDGSIEFEPKMDTLKFLSLLIDISKAGALVESEKRRIITKIQGNLSVESLNDIVRGVLSGAQTISSYVDIASTVHCAACDDHDAVHYILSNASTNVFAVASGGYVKLLKSILQSKIDINTKDSKYGNTALITASMGGHANCVDVLVSRGADVNSKNNEGITALMAASGNGHANCIDVLVSGGANVNASDKDGFTALTWACQGGHMGCINMLLSKGVEIENKDDSGGTALMEASRYGHANCIELLIAQGADINSKDNVGSTALIEASKYGRLRCIDILTAKDTDTVNSNKKHGGSTALMHASMEGHVSCIEMLIARGANVNEKDSDGDTALMAASRGGHVSSIKLLIAKGADVNAEDSIGFNALMHASLLNQAAVVDAFHEAT